MTKKLKNLFLLITLLTLPIILIWAIRQITQPNYLISSIYKLIFITPIIYRIHAEKLDLKSALLKHFNFQTFKSKIKPLLLIGLILALIYFSSFFIFGGLIDLENITKNPNQDTSINAGKLLYIGLFIIIINSVLEEFFRRGFIFTDLTRRQLIFPQQSFPQSVSHSITLFLSTNGSHQLCFFSQL